MYYIVIEIPTMTGHVGRTDVIQELKYNYKNVVCEAGSIKESETVAPKAGIVKLTFHRIKFYISN
jgi:hypothetical protein